MSIANIVEETVRAHSLIAYCDYIAETIAGNLKTNDTDKLLANVGCPRLDLAPEGYLQSTKKTVEVEDRFGRRYRVTVEEI